MGVTIDPRIAENSRKRRMYNWIRDFDDADVSPAARFSMLEEAVTMWNEAHNDSMPPTETVTEYLLLYGENGADCVRANGLENN